MSISNATTAAGTRQGASSRWRTPKWLPLLPFLIFMAIFFFRPMGSVLADSFKDNDGNWTMENFRMAMQDPYRTGFVRSIQLGIYSALSSAIPGAVLAYIIESRGGDRLRRVVSSLSGVIANTGGVPLAFMFIASFGAQGSATTLLKRVGIDLYAGSFSLFSLSGLILVYSYFQIPLMVIVFSPAVRGLRREWHEAARNLGATNSQFWRTVGIPVLFPSFSASFLLLFASAFSAYATARAMTSGAVPLIPLMIGNLVDGSIVVSQMNLGKALALGMVIVTALAMVPYLLLQRRYAKWQQ
jgi:putative spermidine/putrescine transport system permease protein